MFNIDDQYCSNMFVTDIQLMLTDWILTELNKKPEQVASSKYVLQAVYD